jgi:class 3 adenylate cyclase/putative methionine-R-sulfoxide reductase with GAF domain
MSFVNKLSETFTKIHENEELHKFLSIKANSVFYRMTIAFGLFFLGPFVGFLFLGIKSNLLGSNELLYCLLGLMIFSLLGYIILKQISDGIMHIETKLSRNTKKDALIGLMGENELGNIALLADSMDQHLRKTSQALTRRMQEMNALRELGGLSVFHITARSLIDFAVQKAMLITGATGGAVFCIPRNDDYIMVTCQHILGNGINFLAGKSVPLFDFPASAAVSERTVKVLHRQKSDNWMNLFDPKTDCAVAIPFDHRKGHTGVAILVKREGRIWDENGLGFLATFFNTTGSMLRMQELGIRERETTDELKSVLSIIKIINSDLKEKDMLMAISGQLCEVIPSQWVGLALIDTIRSELRLTHTFHRSVANEQTGMILKKDTSLFQTAIDAAELMSIDNLEKEDTLFETPIFAELGLKSCIIQRLDANGKAIGAICLGSDSPHAFSKRDKRMFTMVALGIALALEQTQLLAKERAKRGELEVLNRISVALTSSTFDMNRVLHYILEMISEFIQIEAGTIMLIENDLLTFHATIGIAKNKFDGLRIRIGQEGVSGWVAATGEAIIVQDVADNPHFCADIDGRTGFKTRNLLCVPMISHGRVVGIIELLNKLSGTFNDEDLRAVKSVASSAAIALENSRLYNQSTHLAQQERLIRTIFQKYVPEEIVNDILQKGASQQLTVGERKIVTVFNVDIRGYSAMSKQAATEDVVSVLNFFFMKMGNIIHKYKGVLDKYLGDGLLAIFGAPVSTKNPALDATLAAIEMTEEIDSVSKLSLERCGVPLKIGISINTGEAIVGNIGFDKKMEYTVIGDVVNETFRLQDLTRRKSNSILISESTYQQVKLFVHANQWRVKGLSDREGTMDIYEVVGKKEISDLAYPSMKTVPDSDFKSARIH